MTLRKEFQNFKKSKSTYELIDIQLSFYMLRNLLRNFHYWNNYVYGKKIFSQCPCQVCVLEYLLSLAYQFAKENNIQYHSEWNRNEKADEIWLYEFELRQ